jgi:hypothetical protein
MTIKRGVGVSLMKGAPGHFLEVDEEGGENEMNTHLSGRARSELRRLDVRPTLFHGQGLQEGLFQGWNLEQINFMM